MMVLLPSRQSSARFILVENDGRRQAVTNHGRTFSFVEGMTVKIVSWEYMDDVALEHYHDSEVKSLLILNVKSIQSVHRYFKTRRSHIAIANDNLSPSYETHKKERNVLPVGDYDIYNRGDGDGC